MGNGVGPSWIGERSPVLGSDFHFGRWLFKLKQHTADEHDGSCGTCPRPGQVDDVLFTPSPPPKRVVEPKYSDDTQPYLDMVIDSP